MRVVFALGRRLKGPPWSQGLDWKASRSTFHPKFPGMIPGTDPIEKEHLGHPRNSTSWRTMLHGNFSLECQKITLEGRPFFLQGLHSQQGRISLHCCKSKHDHWQSSCKSIYLSHITRAIRFWFLAPLSQGKKKITTAIHGSKADTAICFLLLTTSVELMWNNTTQFHFQPRTCLHFSSTCQF